MIKEKRALGGIKGKGTPKDRTTRKLVLKKINNVGSYITIPNIYNFKTTQLEINGWIKVHNQDYSQSEINNILNRIRKVIKTRLEEFIKKTERYRKETILIIETGKRTKTNKIRNYQYIKIDIVLFNIFQDYNKTETKYIITPLILEIIEKDLNVQEFSFIKKTHGMDQFT